MKHVLRAFKSRNYRLYFGGQGLSLIGTWMTRMATVWLVYRLTHSAFALGMVGFANQVPNFILSPLAGVLIDRWNRHRVLTLTQTLGMIQSFALAFLSMAGWITLWQVVLLSLAQGIIDAFDNPARQALVADMVEKQEDLANAIALNSSLVHGSRLIGPAIAGILIAKMGEGPCFLWDGISYIPVIGALLAMRIVPRERKISTAHILTDLRQSFRYVFDSPPIRALLLLLGCLGFMGMPYRALLPVFAQEVLHGGADVLGMIMAASGLGALAGALYLAARKSVVGLVKVLVRSGILFGVCLVLFSVSKVLWFSLVMAGIAGFAMLICVAASNTVLQTIVEDHRRGQVMSFYMMAFLGMSSFGSLCAGSLAQHIGAPETLVLGGGCCILGTLAFARQLPKLRKIIRPLYIKLGIIKETSAMMSSAEGLVLPMDQ